MTRGRYIATETAISVAINAILSLAFALLVFGGAETVDTGGRATWLDMAPQSFMIAFMGTFVPLFLTRRRAQAGKLAFTPAFDVKPLLKSAILAAAFAAVCGVAGYALVVREAQVPLTRFVICKAAYGAALAALVTSVALRASRSVR